jgi:cell division protein FtsB
MSPDTIPEKLTFWQKLKRLTGAITAITSFLAILGGSGFWVFNKTDTQDKVQASSYNILAKSVEQIAKRTNKLLIENAELKAKVIYLEKDNDRLYNSMQSFHSRRHIERPEKESVVMSMVPSKEYSEESDFLMGETSVELAYIEIEEKIEEEFKMKYEGAAKLPKFDSIQQMVNKTDEILKE